MSCPNASLLAPDRNFDWAIHRRHFDDFYLGARRETHVQEALEYFVFAAYEADFAEVAAFQFPDRGEVFVASAHFF